MIIRGQARWFKLLGKPHAGYGDTFNEWSTDVYIDDATAAKLTQEGVGHKIKDKGNGKFVSFKRKELKPNGEKNQPVRVVDHRGEAWNPNIKVGNGSVVNVNFAINEFGKGKTDKTMNILSLQVWELVKYEGGEFETRNDGPEDDWSKEVE